jgi:transposase-like protein
MSKNYQRYSEEFKLSVIRDYYSSGMSKYACVRKHQLRSAATLLNWLRKYGNEKKVVSLQSESEEKDMANRSKEDYKDENAQLKKRIRELEKALEFSRLETLARDVMIDKAEEYFDIPIRKKSGAKQP